MTTRTTSNSTGVDIAPVEKPTTISLDPPAVSGANAKSGALPTLPQRKRSPSREKRSARRSPKRSTNDAAVLETSSTNETLLAATASAAESVAAATASAQNKTVTQRKRSPTREGNPVKRTVSTGSIPMQKYSSTSDRHSSLHARTSALQCTDEKTTEKSSKEGTARGSRTGRFAPVCRSASIGEIPNGRRPPSTRKVSRRGSCSEGKRDDRSPPSRTNSDYKKSKGKAEGLARSSPNLKYSHEENAEAVATVDPKKTHSSESKHKNCTVTSALKTEMKINDALAKHVSAGLSRSSADLKEDYDEENSIDIYATLSEHKRSSDCNTNEESLIDMLKPFVKKDGGMDTLMNHVAEGLSKSVPDLNVVDMKTSPIEPLAEATFERSKERPARKRTKSKSPQPSANGFSHSELTNPQETEIANEGSKEKPTGSRTKNKRHLSKKGPMERCSESSPEMGHCGVGSDIKEMSFSSVDQNIPNTNVDPPSEEVSGNTSNMLKHEGRKVKRESESPPSSKLRPKEKGTKTKTRGSSNDQKESSDKKRTSGRSKSLDRSPSRRSKPAGGAPLDEKKGKSGSNENPIKSLERMLQPRPDPPGETEALDQVSCTASAIFRLDDHLSANQGDRTINKTTFPEKKDRNGSTDRTTKEKSKGKRRKAPTLAETLTSKGSAPKGEDRSIKRSNSHGSLDLDQYDCTLDAVCDWMDEVSVYTLETDVM